MKSNRFYEKFACTERGRDFAESMLLLDCDDPAQRAALCRELDLPDSTDLTRWPNFRWHFDTDLFLHFSSGVDGCAEHVTDLVLAIIRNHQPDDHFRMTAATNQPPMAEERSGGAWFIVTKDGIESGDTDGALTAASIEMAAGRVIEPADAQSLPAVILKDEPAVVRRLYYSVSWGDEEAIVRETLTEALAAADLQVDTFRLLDGDPYLAIAAGRYGRFCIVLASEEEARSGFGKQMGNCQNFEATEKISAKAVMQRMPSTPGPFIAVTDPPRRKPKSFLGKPAHPQFWSDAATFIGTGHVSDDLPCVDFYKWGDVGSAIYGSRWSSDSLDIIRLHHSMINRDLRILDPRQPGIINALRREHAIDTAKVASTEYPRFMVGDERDHHTGMATVTCSDSVCLSDKIILLNILTMHHELFFSLSSVEIRDLLLSEFKRARQ